MDLRRLRRARRAVPISMALAVLWQPSPASWGQATTRNRHSREVHVPVVFSGGYETDPRDHGRPVELIAAALGVPADVFREAFSHVRPASAGDRPDPEQVHRNKAALLNALGRYGITNEQLDAVSDHYRYVQSRGERWPTRPASAYAVVVNGTVIRYVVTDAGFGYSSSPNISVPGVSTAAGVVRLSFDRALDRNGSIAEITMSPQGRKSLR